MNMKQPRVNTPTKKKSRMQGFPIDRPVDRGHKKLPEILVLPAADTCYLQVTGYR